MKVWKLYAGDELVADLVVTGLDDPWLLARVEPGPGHERYRPLFAADLAEAADDDEDDDEDDEEPEVALSPRCAARCGCATPRGKPSPRSCSTSTGTRRGGAGSTSARGGTRTHTPHKGTVGFTDGVCQFRHPGNAAILVVRGARITLCHAHAVDAGRWRHAMKAPSAATSATTSEARDIAWTKDSRAGRLGDLRRVERGHDAADDGDAERAAELAGRVVDGGADVRPRGRERAHDRLGRRRAREPHARRPSARSATREPAVARADGDRRRDGQPAANSSMPAVATRLVPKRATSFAESGAKTIIAPA